MWYFYEAYHLANEERRHNVTAQPFGIGGPVTMSWIFLIMGPVYWQIGDAMLAFRVGLAVGFIAILVGSLIVWFTGYMNIETLISTFSDIGFYMPSLSIEEIMRGLKDVGPYLPIIIPLQVANFLTTLQGVESAKLAGDTYSERQSMLMDELFLQ